MVAVRIKHENVHKAFKPSSIPETAIMTIQSLRFAAINLRSQISDLTVQAAFVKTDLSGRVLSEAGELCGRGCGMGSSFTTDGCCVTGGAANQTGSGEALVCLT